MEDIHPVKEVLLALCNESIDQRIDNITSMINSIVEARDNETKSSAGDKHETGRTIMQLEEEKSYSLLTATKRLKAILSQVVITNNKTKKVGLSSLVTTNQGTYFMAVGIGRLLVRQTTYYCISIDSPLGKVLFNKTEGDKVFFNEKAIILELVE